MAIEVEINMDDPIVLESHENVALWSCWNINAILMQLTVVLEFEWALRVFFFFLYKM